MRLSYEQPSSAHGALTRAGVKHGDKQKIELVVGATSTQQGVHLAFCSAEVRRGKRLRKGYWRERRLPITGDIEFNNYEAVTDRLKGHTGFAYMQAIVETNGHVVLHVDPDSIQPFRPVGCENHLRSSSGRPFARKILEAVKA